MGRCAVFAGGFDVAVAAHLCGGDDAYPVINALDSSGPQALLTTTQGGGHTRYGMYETIRVLAEEQIDPESLAAVRDRHARYFPEQVESWWTTWDSPDQRLAWTGSTRVPANLRAGFYWAAEHGDIVTATKIAAHTAMFAQSLQRYEPVGWAERAARRSDRRRRGPAAPAVHGGPFCSQIGRPETGVAYARRAAELKMRTRS